GINNFRPNASPLQIDWYCVDRPIALSPKVDRPFPKNPIAHSPKSRSPQSIKNQKTPAVETAATQTKPADAG
ncbi:hypothetical protein, partial [Microcoleus sp. herbarium12]|uniref:hypothetical protein n=1 Tax=Microcoleus sp. herbarium12 TaxID=3055437 RepID=UPI002FCF21EB